MIKYKCKTVKMRLTVGRFKSWLKSDLQCFEIKLKHIVHSTGGGNHFIEPAFLICSQMSILHIISGGYANKSERAEEQEEKELQKTLQKKMLEKVYHR